MGVLVFSAIKIFLGWTPVEINPCARSAVLFLSDEGMLVLLEPPHPQLQPWGL